MSQQGVYISLDLPIILLYFIDFFLLAFVTCENAYKTYDSLASIRSILKQMAAAWAIEFQRHLTTPPSRWLVFGVEKKSKMKPNPE